MMVHKDSRGVGSLKLDRVFPKIGRLSRASGIADTPEGRKRFKRMNAMLTDLFQAGKHDYLKRLVRREITPLQLWAAYQTQTLDAIPTPDLAQPLGPALDTWIAQSRTGAQNHAQRKDTRRILYALAPKATVGEIANVLRTYQQTSKPSMFNHVKTHCQKFAAEMLGKSHRLYADLLGVERLKVQRKRKRGLTKEEALAVFAFLPEPYRTFFRHLCYTGMRPTEYLSGEWEVRQDRLEVHGTKTCASERVIPLVVGISRVERVTLPMLRHHLNKWPEGKLEPYTARRTFAHAMEEANIPRSRRTMYLGHSGKDVSDLYERSHLTAYLREDGEKLRGFWGTEGIRLVEAKG